MNKLIYNYPAEVEATRFGRQVVDGKTFDCVWDRGYGDYSRRRFQLQDVDLPDTRYLKQKVTRGELSEGEAEDLLRKFDRARLCLSLLLLGEQSLEGVEEGSEPPNLEPALRGRRVLISTLRPNRYGRGAVRVYVEARRNSFAYTRLGTTVASHHFLDVGKAMYYASQPDVNYSLDQMREVLDEFEPMDLSL